MDNWLLLHYKLPTNPSAPRVYIWRKLKQMGALLIQDAVWVLPHSPRTLEQFQWLAAEINEMGGDAIFWQAQAVLNGQDDDLRGQFNAQVDVAYADILEQLKVSEPDFGLISRQYQQVRAKDHFHSPLGEQIRSMLLDARGEST